MTEHGLRTGCVTEYAQTAEGCAEVDKFLAALRAMTAENDDDDETIPSDDGNRPD